MCVIVVKAKGTPMPSKASLLRCWKVNPDGAGFSVRHPKQDVHYEKGFQKFEDFYNAVKDFKKSDEVVMHFRISTQGGINQSMTHPFKLSTKKADMFKLKGDGDVLFHNGIIRLTSTPEVRTDYPNESDTSVFTRKFATPLIQNDGINQLSIEGIGNLVGYSNKIIIHSKKGIFYIGNFFKGNDGCWYSNTHSFPTYRYVPTYKYENTILDPATWDKKEAY